MALEGLKGSVLEQIWLSEDREPAFRVCIWNPRFATVQDVVLDRWQGHRYDISDFVERITIDQNQVFENNDDAVSSRAQIDIVSEEHPGLTVGNGNCPVTERLFRDGTPIRIYEGDRRVARGDWPPIFTGTIRGYPGASVALRGNKRIIRIQAFGRAQAFQKQIIVGINWDYGTDLGTMAVDVAMVEMGLQREEIRFGEFGHETRQKANALARIGKIQGLFEIMHHVGRKPYFDGRGFLVAHDTRFDKPPIAIYPDGRLIRSVQRVQSLQSTVNSVEVIGLDSTLSQVVQSSQALAEANVSVGYFDSSHREDIYYSKDRRRRAQDTFITVAHGGSSGFLDSEAEWQEVDEFHGRLTIDTGFAPWVLGLISLVWGVLSVMEYGLDLLIAESGGSVGFFVALLRFEIQVAKAAAMFSAQYIMTRIGRWRIFIHGKPFEFVHQELRAIAALSGIPVADVVERSDSLHWLYEIGQVQARAKALLSRELVKSHTYEIVMMSNGILEVDDIIVLHSEQHGLPGFNWFYINSINRAHSRGPAPGTMSIRAWLIRTADSI